MLTLGQGAGETLECLCSDKESVCTGFSLHGALLVMLGMLLAMLCCNQGRGGRRVKGI